jgi:hypothetical protein
LSITSSSTFTNAATNSVKAQLLANGTAPSTSGQSITFTATPIDGGTAKTFAGSTTSSGATTAVAGLLAGYYSLTATFAGDASYQSSSATQTLYVYLPTRFVIWGGNPGSTSPNVTIGQDYNFWGSTWANQVTGGTYPTGTSFYGWATSTSGTTWTNTSGTATTGIPTTIQSYIGVNVATAITTSGTAVNGDIAETVVLKADSPTTYTNSPTNPASGVMKAVVH